MLPEISVIMPVYNSEATIEKALRSIQSQQTIPALEIICVDDGSTDGSLEILEEIAQIDSRIIILTQKNQFAGMARNRGMAQAKGKYVVFLDADDCYLPGALRSLYQNAEENQLDMVKGSFYCMNVQTGEVTRPQYSQNNSIKWPNRGRVIRFSSHPFQLLGASDVPWNGLYRRAFLKQHHIQFNELQCVNDHSFYIDCLIHAKRIMVVDTEIACYHIGQMDSLVGKKAQHFYCNLASYFIVRDLCKEISPKLRQIILQQELANIFGWYEKLQRQGNAPGKMEKELKNFLFFFEEQDVGERFLCAFPYADLYYQIRYNAKPPHGRPSMPMRALRCLKEHGWQYTISRIIKKGYRQ